MEHIFTLRKYNIDRKRDNKVKGFIKIINKTFLLFCIFTLYLTGVNIVGFAQTITGDVLVVSGGGSGGAAYGGGGGGGAVKYFTSQTISGSVSVTVGTGGAAITIGNAGNPGQSSFFGLLTATSGSSANAPNGGGGGGGSGGGINGTFGISYISGGTALSGMGNNGGGTIGDGVHFSNACGGGGGGAGANGGDGNVYYNTAGGAGGIGIANSITGTSVYYGGGGGGGVTFNGSSAGAGGNGGGGSGSKGDVTATSGTANTGGGGGGYGASNGTGSNFSGAGGSGIVIIRYLSSTILATGGTITQVGGYTIHTFYNSGTFTVNRPTFTNISPQTFTVCQNASATSINNLLTISDAQTGKTESWSVTTTPTHGTLGGFNATHASGSTSITPTGLTYTPTSGYNGIDAFTIQVSDGTATASMTVNVTVNTVPAFSSCVPNQTANTTSNSCANTVAYSSTEVVTGNPTPTITYVFSGATTGSGSGDGSGSSFNKGTTTVTLTATNTCGTTTCSFTVVVNDVTPPTITCPATISIAANAAGCTANNVSLETPNVSDNCSGVIGNALNFTANNEIITGSDAGLPSGTAARTIESWVKWTSVNPIGPIFKYGSLNSSGTPFELGVHWSGKAYFWGQNADVAGNTNINDGNWHHIAVTYDGTTVKLYVDGNLDASGTPTLNTQLTGSYYLGKDPGSNWKLNGSIDEVRVWNVARTQAQIQANMNTEINPQTGLLRLFHFNQGVAGGINNTISIAIDASGNNYNGTLTGFALSGPTSNLVSGVFGSITNNAPSSFPIGNTTITWTATDASGNTANCNQTVTVTNPLTAVITGTGTACGSVSLTATPSSQTTYLWSGGSSTHTASNTFTSSGTYNVTITNGNGCTASTSQVVTINPLPTPTISGPTNLCNYTTANVYTTESGMSSYNWTVNGGTITAGAGTNAITVAWNTAGSESVSVNYANSNGCSAASATVYGITVKSAPNPVITGSPDNNYIVPKLATYQYSTPLVAGDLYSWSSPKIEGYCSATARNCVNVHFLDPCCVYGQWTINVTETNPTTGCSTIATKLIYITP